MINKKIIWRVLGYLLYIESALLVACSGFGFYYRENDCYAFLVSAAITLLGGVIFTYKGRHAERKFGRRDGYIVVSISWILFSLFGMLPYYISGHIPSITDAFFETMSGFTTTGASILDNIESLPHGLLFWRSMTQWIGGLGIIFFTIAVLPVFGVGGVQLFAAEATGPKHDKVHPRIEVTAKWIWSIYLGLTIAETILLSFGGMGWFDSICHSLTTTATGGYSTRQESIAAFDSIYIEYIITIFMFLSGINFTLLFYLLFKGKFNKLSGDTEFRWYSGIVLSLTLITTIVLLCTKDYGIEESFRKSLFQIVSIQTTTGFSTCDYMLWPPILWFLIILLMYCGACAGSTSGSIKCVRIAMLFKVIQNDFQRIIHPNAIIPLRINGQVVHSKAKITLLAFFAVYVMVILVGWGIMISLGLNFAESYGVVVSSVCNVGPALGSYGPAYSWAHMPDAGKWVCSFLMLIGRLELFSILLLFTPGFWKRK